MLVSAHAHAPRMQHLAHTAYIIGALLFSLSYHTMTSPCLQDLPYHCSVSNTSNSMHAGIYVMEDTESDATGACFFACPLLVCIIYSLHELTSEDVIFKLSTLSWILDATSRINWLRDLSSFSLRLLSVALALTTLSSK